MWRIVQQPEPDDFVLAAGETRSVREFVERAFAEVDMDIEWQGEGADERGLDSASGRVPVKVDPRYFRPTEVEILLGDPSEAEQKLGWRHQTTFEQLVKEMVAADLETVRMEHNRQDRHD